MEEKLSLVDDQKSAQIELAGAIMVSDRDELTAGIDPAVADDDDDDDGDERGGIASARQIEASEDDIAPPPAPSTDLPFCLPRLIAERLLHSAPFPGERRPAVHPSRRRPHARAKLCDVQPRPRQ